jgi:hypothetical protein
MKKNLKAIIIFISLILCSCETHHVAAIRIYPSSIGKIGNFTYEIFNDRIIIKGNVKDELFVGEYYTGILQKLFSKKNLRNIPKGHTRVILRGAYSNIIDCYIRKTLFLSIKAGSRGICYYVPTGESFQLRFLKK